MFEVYFLVFRLATFSRQCSLFRAISSLRTVVGQLFCSTFISVFWSLVLLISLWFLFCLFLYIVGCCCVWPRSSCSRLHDLICLSRRRCVYLANYRLDQVCALETRFYSHYLRRSLHWRSKISRRGQRHPSINSSMLQFTRSLQLDKVISQRFL